jgi:hypothetical protein
MMMTAQNTGKTRARRMAIALGLLACAFYGGFILLAYLGNA